MLNNKLKMQKFLDGISEIASIEYQDFTNYYWFLLGSIYEKNSSIDYYTLKTLQKIQDLSQASLLQMPIEMFLLFQTFSGKNISAYLEIFESTIDESLIQSLFSLEEKASLTKISEFFNNYSKNFIVDEAQFCANKESDMNEDYSEAVYQKIENFEQTYSCLLCYQEMDKSEIIFLNSCKDVYHVECFNKYLIFEISEKHLPLTCPKCELVLLENDLRERLTYDEFYKYQRFSIEFVAEKYPNEYSCCPTPDCSFIFLPNHETHFECPQCSKEYCLKCRVEYHKGITCEDYQIYYNGDSEDLKFFIFVKGQKFKQCPQCKFWVEKAIGCNHMTCRCTFQFCYLCAAKYKTCNCKDYQN